MWSSPRTRNAAVAIACATLVALAAAPTARRIVQWRMAQRWQRHEPPKQKKMPLRELQSNATPPRTWVALCGTVFDVGGDPFFDARAGGIYASWLGHDVAALLVYGGVIDGRPEHESEAALLDVEIELQDVESSQSELAARRRRILDEWYARFHSRYEAVAQISDLYAGNEWEALRDQLTPPGGDDGRPQRRGKCPLGFGSSAVEEEQVQIRDEDISSLRAIRFQGRRYDVRGSMLFDGSMAHFVGHDITYALATQSNNPKDLDIVPTREYTYDEQIRLEQYRRAFAKELRVISTPNDKTEVVPQAEVTVVDLHQLIDQDTSVEEIRRALNEARAFGGDDLNTVCPRTTLTPLHKAVEKNRLELVKLLVEAGANVEAPAALYDDETALQIAQRFKYSEIATVLSAHLTN